MRCDLWASLLARNIANPCFGREPKAKVVTLNQLQVNFSTLNIIYFTFKFYILPFEGW
jgi:hypothetical protein